PTASGVQGGVVDTCCCHESFVGFESEYGVLVAVHLRNRIDVQRTEVDLCAVEQLRQCTGTCCEEAAGLVTGQQLGDVRAEQRRAARVQPTHFITCREIRPQHIQGVSQRSTCRVQLSRGEPGESTTHCPVRQHDVESGTVQHSFGGLQHHWCEIIVEGVRPQHHTTAC